MKSFLRGPRRVLLPLWLLGILLSALTGWLVQRHNEEALDARLQALVEDKQRFIQAQFLRYESGLRGTLGAVLAAGGEAVTRPRIEDYFKARKLPQEFPGARGFGFVRRVPQAQERAFLAQARAEGPADFSIQALAPHPGDRFVLQYIYPEQNNRSAWGLDMAGEARRRDTALEAMRSGEVQLTAPLTLVNAQEHPHGGMVMVLAAYRGADVPGTVAEREAATFGWVVVPIVAPEVLHSDGAVQAEFAYVLTDVLAGSTLYASPGHETAAVGAAARRTSRQLTLYGRRWELQAHALPALSAPGMLMEGWRLAAGLSLLCTLLAFTSCQLLQVRSRQRDLQQEADDFTAGIVDAAPQALLVVNDQGRIVRANHKAADLFGYTLGQMLGLPVDALVGQAHQHSHAQLRAGYDGRARAIGSRPGLSARRHDGSEFTASLNLSPLRINGQQFVVAGLTDITAQQEAFTALERSERRWQEVAHVLPCIVWSCDAQGASEFVNRRWNDYTGQPSDPVPTQDQWLEAVHPDDRAAVVAAWLHSVQSHTAYHIEYRLRRHDGDYHWFEVRGAPLLGELGQVLRWIGAFVDIDARRQAEDELRRMLQCEEQRVAERTAELDRARRDLKNILDALPSLISYWDRDLVNRYANRAVRDWLGLDPDGPTRPSLREVLGEELYAASLPNAQAALRGEARHFERSFQRPDGQGMRHSITHYLPDVVDGEVRGFYSLVHDVTEIVQGRQDLAIERERLHNILRGTDVGTWEWNVQTGELRINDRWAAMLGFTVEELQPVSAQTWQRLAHPDDLARALGLLQRHFKGKLDFFECEGRMRHRDGHWVWVQASGRVLTHTPDGRAQWMYAISQDISERHAAATALQQAKQAAESANAAKSEFLANMSHEIRTPLNAVIGLAYLLEQSRLDARQRDSVAKIQVASRSLLGVINDVLDLAKIEARQMDLESRTFDLRALLQDLHDLFTPQAQAKGLRLVVEEAPATPDLLVGDDTRLRQILVNLLSNALKFTEVGEVALRLRTQPAQGGRISLHFEVCDTGIGISEEALQRLFAPFTQAEAGTTRRFGGTGLGLSIVRRLAELMGGEACARSVPGQGSCFSVTVEMGLGQGAGQAGSALQVAIISDETPRRDTLQALCRSLGWRVQAMSAAQAAACCADNGALQPAPDVLVLDGESGSAGPGPTGSAAWIPALQGAMDNAAVVLVDPSSLHTGSTGSTGDVSAPPPTPLNWPATTSSLFSAVMQALSRHDGNMRALASTGISLPNGVRALPGVRVLVVDDSSINQEVAQRILELQGASVSTCSDGQQALERLRDEPSACDVVLMDVQMPVMDGLEATRRLRGELGLSRLPVLALTAGALVSERANAREAGMDDFITKPLDPQALVRTVRWHVEKAKGRALPYETQPGEPQPQSLRPWPQIAGVDTAAAAQRVGYDAELFVSLMRRLLQECADLEDAAQIDHQLSTDPATFAARMHRLRGSAAMLGMESVEVVAQAFETSLREGTLTPVEQQGLGEDLAHAIQTSRAACSPLLQAEEAPTQPVHVATDIDPVQLARFIELLARRSLEAEQAFERIAPQLRSVLDGATFTRLRDAMEGLQFDIAREMVQELLPQ